MSDRHILPANVKPKHYELELYGLDLQKFTYDGVVKIELDFQSKTKSIKLNAKELTFKNGSLSITPLASKNTISSSSFDEKAEILSLEFSEDIPPSGSGLLMIEFSGVINHEMAGFYRSAYTNAAGNNLWMFSTQFESCDARRAFPCFDEPNLKTTLDFSITIPKIYTALSNQPVSRIQNLSHSLKKVTFLRTPKMSTYLYAWAVGDFEYIEAFTDREYGGRGKLPVRVYTTKDLSGQGVFALESARKIVDYFSEIFEIEYPLPKLDLLAVHEFSHGAMENWGLITYRTTAVLFDDRTSDARYKVRVAYVVAHELAHQHFGNLVTMDWWSELWLNEGFATWVGWLATDHFHPEWDVWGQFVAESLQTAFQLDSLRGSHPIEVPVKNALEIDQIFDHISYLKGAGTIRMLSTFLGVETFLKGVAKYLQRHVYGNATTEDLWRALSEQSEIDVASFMRTWIKTIGFPVLTVKEGDSLVTIRQSRFLITGDVEPEDDNTIWWVPLMIAEESHAGTESQVQVLDAKELTLRKVGTSFYKLNRGHTGFYRVHYLGDQLLRLEKSLHKLSASDKVGLIADVAATSFAGYGTTPGLLGFISALRNENSFLVWSGITAPLKKLRSLFAATGPEIVFGLKRFTLELVTPIVDKLGWEYDPDEDFLTGRLRSLLIATAGGVGHEGVIIEARKRFHTYMVNGDKSSIHPNLRLAVFRIAVAEGGQREFDYVVEEYHSSTTVDGKEICLSSLGWAKDPDLIQQTLELMLSEKVKIQDKHKPAIALSNNSAARSRLWAFIQTNWDEVHRQMSGNMVVLDRFLKNSLNKFAQESYLEEILEFFSEKDNVGYDKGLAVIADSIRGNALYVRRDKVALEQWLRSHAYIGGPAAAKGIKSI